MLILVIDDHPLYRDALTRLLPQIFEGARVLSAGDWASAARLLEAECGVALALLDLEMPGTHGRGALTALRADHPEIRVVIVSASESAAEARRCLAEGAQGFIPKSARTEVLAAALRLVCEGGVYVPPLLLEPPPAGPACDEALTARELQILALLCDGLSNKAIARRLQIAEPTVRAHLSAVFRALGVVNRTQAARVARTRGLVNEE
ncbi:MAG: response regulator transcription factor [Gammaproteobacteria bacterium]|nr:response regulator transcription factor [Gammaproteobacteria bacterium]